MHISVGSDRITGSEARFAPRRRLDSDLAEPTVSNPSRTLIVANLGGTSRLAKIIGLQVRARVWARFGWG
eukprot:1332638-Amorphochlora_amoeboformis.AAC.1